MAQRIVTSAIGLVVFFSVFFANEEVFALAVAFLIFMSMYEINKALPTGRKLSIINYIASAVMFFALVLEHHIIALAGVVMLYMISSVILYPEYSFKSVYSSAFASAFVTLFFGALMTIRVEFGAEATFLVFVFSWITDTGAYFSGRFFGKKKLIERVSPKKTVEGAIGGVVSTVVFTCAYLAILKNCFGIEDIAGSGYMGVSVLAFFASIMAQFGDLAASVIKRECGIKDFGSLLPGHGGILDRFDSVIFISPMVLFYFLYF